MVKERETEVSFLKWKSSDVIDILKGKSQCRGRVKIPEGE